MNDSNKLNSNICFIFIFCCMSKLQHCLREPISTIITKATPGLFSGVSHINSLLQPKHLGRPIVAFAAHQSCDLIHQNSALLLPLLHTWNKIFCAACQALNFASQANRVIAWARARWFRMWANFRAHAIIRENLHAHETNPLTCVHMQIANACILGNLFRVHAYSVMVSRTSVAKKVPEPKCDRRVVTHW